MSVEAHGSWPGGEAGGLVYGSDGITVDSSYDVEVWAFRNAREGSFAGIAPG